MQPIAHASLPHQDQLLADYLQAFLGELEPVALALLRQHLQWVEVAGGEVLMQQGEPGDALYLAVSGRLRAYVQQDDGTQRAVREMSRGQIIGEMSLITDEPRSATVVAIRDSVLVRLDKVHFAALLATSPQLSLVLTRQIIRRLQTEQKRNPMAMPVTIGLLPVTAGVDAQAFAHSLATQLRQHGSVCVVDARSLADAGAGDNRSIALRLDEIEAAHDFVLLAGDASPTAWTQRCARHCDELLLLADADAEPVLHANETECLMRRAPRTEAAEILVLLHPADRHCPRGTRRWLARRPVGEHIHVRPSLPADMARLARIEARRAVGLVLAGGGARGFAHLGVMKALQERGIEIDCVGGTSIGAVMALGLASAQPLAHVTELTRKAFAVNPTGDWNLVPLLSLIKGVRLRHLLDSSVRTLLGFDADVEDLWKGFFCVATNYSQAREQVLRHGPLATVVRASLAIPGALPPVVMGGDLLCDGGTFNNFPVDVMVAQRGVGRVIGVDLNFRKPRKLPSDEVPGSWALLRDRLRPKAQRRWRFPSLPGYLMNVTILYSMARQRQAERLADLVINPPLERVGLLAWHRFDSIVQQGYDHACQVLDTQAHGFGKGAAAPALPAVPAVSTAAGPLAAR